MEEKRKEKVFDWLQEVNKQDETCNHADFNQIESDAIQAAGALCGALSRALDSNPASAKHYNLACHELASGGLTAQRLATEAQAGAVVRYLLALAGRIDPERHAELARLLLTNWPPCRLLDSAGLDRYRRLCLHLASRHPDLRQLAMQSAVVWFSPALPDGTAQAEDFKTDRRQFSLAHRLLEALASAFPASAPGAICDLAESHCLWGRPTRQLACYLLNVLRAAATYLGAGGSGGGLRTRLLFVACRTVAKLESLADETAGVSRSFDGTASVARCTCAQSAAAAEASAACLASRQSSATTDTWWKLTPELHSLLLLASPAAGGASCRACDQRLKLNACLHPLLCYVRAELDPSDWPRTKAVYKDLLTVFDRELAHLAGPSRLHLLLALACSANDRIAHGFLDYLWKRAIDSHLGANFRLRCLSLLGDLCARCAFVHQHLLHTVLLLLVDRARLMASKYNKRAGTLGADEASLFHACVRAVVRIAVHRHRELLDGAGKDGACLSGMHFHLVLLSSLQPWPALPQQLRSRFALLCRRYSLDDFISAIASLSDGCEAADSAAATAPLSAKKKHKKRRRTTLDPASATALAPAAEEPLSASLEGLGLCEPLLRPLLLPDEPLPSPPPTPPTASNETVEMQQQPSKQPQSQPPAQPILAEPPAQPLLAEALQGPGQLFARRRKRLRSDCVVFGESA
ncbi:hypothetical protein BOX15_Mlig003267g1 [Macrostomum lignano]|uniref:Uncharacterized protein n=1 Tax=Macrostomum lignano TaxID=282301 RepID=A0A267EFB4_9PLAT|nr:hypothetical protein BOX15_Mlig003267g1 [Macrostomum lignano]